MKKIKDIFSSCKNCGCCQKTAQKWKTLKEHKNYPTIRRVCFYVLAVFALFIPDLMLSGFVYPKVYTAHGITLIFIPPRICDLWHLSLLADVLPFIFSGMWIAIFLLFTNFILPKRLGKILYIIIGSVFFFYAFCQYVFSGIFDGQFFRLESLGLAGEGANYLSYALSYIDLKLIAYTVLEIICLVFVGKLWEKPVFKHKSTKIFSKAAFLIPVAVLSLVHLSMHPSDELRTQWNAWQEPQVIYDDMTDANKGLDITGVYHFAVRDTYKALSGQAEYTEEQYSEVDKFFEKKAEEYQPNEYTGMFEGKNVIAIMLESMDDWLVTDESTPTLKYMMNNGINFSDYYAPQYGTGLTLGAEFCFHTGYYTPISGVSPINYANNYFPYAIPKLFADKGYSVNSFHYNHSEFYNRGYMHNSVGYQKYHSFMDDYNVPENEAISDSNILKHEEIFNDIVKDEPFFSFIITYSAHVPYDVEDSKLKLAKENHPDLIDPAMDTETNNCYILARDTDDFLRMLLEKLHETGKLEDTVIILFADHDAYGFSDHDKLLQYSIEAGCSNVHRVPGVIFNYGTAPMDVSKPCQAADWAPTLVNLFNLENHHCYIGSDMLSPQNEGFVHFANYSWIEGDMIFMPGITIYDAEDSIHGQMRTQEAIKINDIVVAGDYFNKRR